MNSALDYHNVFESYNISCANLHQRDSQPLQDIQLSIETRIVLHKFYFIYKTYIITADRPSNGDFCWASLNLINNIITRSTRKIAIVESCWTITFMQKHMMNKIFIAWIDQCFVLYRGNSIRSQAFCNTYSNCMTCCCVIAWYFVYFAMISCIGRWKKILKSRDTMTNIVKFWKKIQLTLSERKSK